MPGNLQEMGYLKIDILVPFSFSLVFVSIQSKVLHVLNHAAIAANISAALSMPLLDQIFQS